MIEPHTYISPKLLSTFTVECLSITIASIVSLQIAPKIAIVGAGLAISALIAPKLPNKIRWLLDSCIPPICLGIIIALSITNPPVHVGVFIIGLISPKIISHVIQQQLETYQAQPAIV